MTNDELITRLRKFPNGRYEHYVAADRIEALAKRVDELLDRLTLADDKIEELHKRLTLTDDKNKELMDRIEALQDALKGK